MKQVPGSKPRKLIPRTILTNPSLISLEITSLLNPDKNLSKIYEAIQAKQKIQTQNSVRIYNSLSPQKKQSYANSPEKIPRMVSYKSTQLDSLQQAENQFLKKKFSQPEIDANTQAFQKRLQPKKSIDRESSYLSRGSSSPSLLTKDLHYNNSQCMIAIMKKQSRSSLNLTTQQQDFHDGYQYNNLNQLELFLSNTWVSNNTNIL